MKMSKFLLISLLLLVPCEVLQKCGPKAVSCDYTASYDVRKKEFHDENNSTSVYNKDDMEALTYEASRPVRVRYDPRPEEKKKINMRQEALCRQEMETVKEAAAKQQARKCERAPKPVELPVKVQDGACKLPVLGGSVMCAECEQCELQVKANGEGVMLRCTECRAVPADEVMFPAGNNRRVIKFP